MTVTVDTTYSYFGAPSMDNVPSSTKSSYSFTQKKVLLHTESSRSSQPDVVRYAPSSSAVSLCSLGEEEESAGGCNTPSSPLTREVWIEDSSYGYWGCPTLDLEPTVVVKPSTSSRRRHEQQRKPSPVVDYEHEGYSFFGI